MKCIKLRDVQAVRERLLEQISILRILIEQTEEMERRLQGQYLMEEPLLLIRKSREELEEELRGYQDMTECLLAVCKLCQKTEEAVTEVYNLERIFYPKTEFGINSLTSLEPFADILSFQDSYPEEPRMAKWPFGRG